MKVYVALMVPFALLVGTEPPNELDCYNFDGRHYRGTIHKTINGRACQAWSKMVPHIHSRTKERFPYSGLEENYCRNPDGELGPWCYTTDPSKRFELCDVPRCDSLPELGCYTFDGRHYRGTLSTTTLGRTCQAWSSQTPHKHLLISANYPDSGMEENYCRNPNGVAPMPWCYTADKKRRWEYCQVPQCAVAEDPELDCYSFDGRRYRGTIHQTINGRACQAWSDVKPHGHSRVKENYPYSGLEENYCRNPDGEQRPWCYTTDPSRRWEFCNVPRCDLRPELACYTLDGRNYRGDIASTSSGRHCQDWAAQRPHEHTRTEIDFPDKGLDQPYCRNPDGAAKPWCYTTDQQRRWEYCEIPRCYVPVTTAPPPTTPTLATTRTTTTNPNPNPTLTPLVLSVTEAEQQYIVNKHNELRRGVLPTATDILKMSWNEEAAINAQKWANKCSMQHSPREEKTTSTETCGENLFMGSRVYPWESAIMWWYNEIENWEYEVGSTNGKVVLHFTQLVWYRSNSIGCAMAHCPDQPVFKYIYVCQYCPTGNVGSIGKPFTPGVSCSACPHACDDKLCTNPCTYYDDSGWNNCGTLAADYGCDHVTIKQRCQATCQCNGDIH